MKKTPKQRATVSLHETQPPVQDNSIVDEVAIFKAFSPDSEECWIAILNHPLDDEQQKVVAELVDIWRSFHYIDIPIVLTNAVQQMRIAVALALSSGKLELAKSLKDQLNGSVGHYKKRNRSPMIAGIRGLIYGLDQPKHNRILLGLFCILYFAIPIIIVSSSRIGESQQVLGIPTNDFLSAIVFGSLGSIISIMLRYDRVDVSTAHDTNLFFIGIFKPITGAVFALVVLGIYKSGILPIKLNETVNAETYFLIPLFFLSGFSERFVGDLLSKVEDVASARNSTTVDRDP